MTQKCIADQVFPVFESPYAELWLENNTHKWTNREQKSTGEKTAKHQDPHPALMRDPDKALCTAPLGR